MEKEVLQTLINENLSSHQIAQRLGMSQTNVSYWLRKFGLNTFHTPHVANCSICNTPLKGKQMMFCSKKCKGEDYSNAANNYLNQKERASNRKIELINLKGGKCQRCGYAKNYSALCFHHRDPSNKAFSLDSRNLSNTNMNSLLEESRKCDLLCSNCHMEIHYPHLDLLVLPPGLEPGKRPYEDHGITFYL